MKHCPTCSCQQQKYDPIPRDPNCPACSAPNKARWDVHGIARRISSGEITASDAAVEIGISRQGVDQALRKHGVHEAVAEGRISRTKAWNEGRIARARALADQPKPYALKAVTAIPTEYMLESIRAVHKFLNLGDQAMSHKMYDQFAPDHLPSGSAIMDRFQTWNSACDQAGIPFNLPAARRVYERIPRSKALDDLKRYILEYREEKGRYAVISNMRYEAWAMHKENNAVSRAHISKRYGWSEMLGEALAELYGKEDDASVEG